MALGRWTRDSGLHYVATSSLVVLHGQAWELPAILRRPGRYSELRMCQRSFRTLMPCSPSEQACTHLQAFMSTESYEEEES